MTEGNGEGYDLTYVSLGGGVQSSAMLVCSALRLHGVPRADCAIFADTMHELKDTYDFVGMLSTWAGERGVPVHTVSRGDLLEGVLVKRQWKKGMASLPLYTLNEDGRRGMLHRQCTQDYKIEAVGQKVREILGLKPRQVGKGKFRVRALIGISTDEAHRAKPANDGMTERHYPLLDARMHRQDCESVLRENGMEIPLKSACYFCPFRSDAAWAWMKRNRPDSFAKAVEVDLKVRDLSHGGVRNPTYLHGSLKPLGQVDFEDGRQLQLDGFGNDCTGTCGV